MFLKCCSKTPAKLYPLGDQAPQSNPVQAQLRIKKIKLLKFIDMFNLTLCQVVTTSHEMARTPSEEAQDMSRPFERDMICGHFLHAWKGEGQKDGFGEKVNRSIHFRSIFFEFSGCPAHSSSTTGARSSY